MHPDKTEEYIQMLAKLIMSEEVEDKISPLDYYNHWIQDSGIHIADLELAFRLLIFIEEALHSNKQLLSYFL